MKKTRTDDEREAEHIKEGRMKVDDISRLNQRV